MEKYDWVGKIKLCITLLRFVGLWPQDDDTHHLDLYSFYAIVSQSVFYVAHILVQGINIYFIRNDLAAVTGTIYVLLLEVMTGFKIYNLIVNMKTLKELLKDLDTDTFQPKNSQQLQAVETNIWYWNVLYKSFFYASIGTNLIWAIYPLVDKKESEERRLPFLAWYPFDTQTSPGYEFAYLHQVISVAFTILCHVDIDGLSAAIMVFNGSQFDILCDNLRNLHKLGENVSENLVKCIEHHKKILKFANKCNKFLNWILFIQFFVGAFSIGITMFELTLVVPLSNEFLSLVTYGLAIIVQTFMYCWFGNEIEIKSNNVLYASFQSEWTNFPIATQKDLLFFTLRAEEPVKLSSFNLFYSSLDTFMKILKSAWSYFALLHQVNSRS